MGERLTKDISRYQGYCQFELKDCRYKDIYNFEHYSELEECVDCDLTLGIDKLGEYENIDTDPKHLAKIKQTLEIIKENALYVDWIWLFDCVVNNRPYKDYIDGCEATKETTYAEEEEYELFKEVLL